MLTLYYFLATWVDVLDNLFTKATALVAAFTALVIAITTLIKFGGIRRIAGDAQQQAGDAKQQANDAKVTAGQANTTAEVAKSKAEDLSTAHLRNADDIRSLNEQTTKLANQLPPTTPPPEVKPTAGPMQVRT